MNMPRNGQKAAWQSSDGAYDLAPTGGAERELDAAIAEKVMGWTKWRSPAARTPEPDCWKTGDEESPTRLIAYWSPSTDIAAAWLALDWLRTRRDVVCLTFDARDNYWEIDACDHIDYHTNLRDDGSKPRGCAVIVSAATAPRAICRAALSLATANPRAAVVDTR
jgi:hypothetical protein